MPSKPIACARRVAALCLAAALTVAGVEASAVAANAHPAPAGSGPLKAGRYMVILKDDPAATYRGGVGSFAATRPSAGEQLDATSAPVSRWSKHLRDEQTDLAGGVGASVGYHYTLLTNGFSAHLTAAQATRLATTPGVQRLVRDELLKVQAAPAGGTTPKGGVKSTDYLGLSGPGGVWAQAGGISRAGRGIVVGVVDTGIAPENPSFAGGALSSTPSRTSPYVAGNQVVFHKADGSVFRSTRETGVQWDLKDYSTKIIGARYYVSGFGAANVASTADGEYLSPRDGDGHGSHTSSTAAGDPAVRANVAGTDFGTISGVAPAAKIAMYKACWTGNVPDTTDDDGCATTDTLAALDQATQDGVDVINYSIGGGSDQDTVDITDQAFLNAAAAGIVVSASAGNSGPGATTLDNGSPWNLTVAASTIPDYEGTVVLGNGAKYAGASITVTKPTRGRLVAASAVAASGTADATLCGPDSLDPAKARGTIVICTRGTYDRIAKSAEVARAGGIGMVLVNTPDPDDIEADQHAVPTVHVHAAAATPILAYAATSGATATLVPGNTTGIVTPVPQIAGFSSRGPDEADDSDVLKPDVAAPGVDILAAFANAEGEAPTWNFLSGTSMAAPHVAGLAALYLGVHPRALPSEVRSALMTTARNTVDATGAPVTDVFAQGAGQVVPRSMLRPGLVYLADTDDYLAYIAGLGYAIDGVTPVDPSDLNQPSISIGSLAGTQTVKRSVRVLTAGTYHVTAALPGVHVTVSPSTFTARRGQTVRFTVRFDRTSAPLATFSTGYLTWRGPGATTVRSPMAVRPVAISAPADITGTGTSGSTTFSVVPGSGSAIPVTTAGLVPGTVSSGSLAAAGVATVPVTIPAGADAARFSLDTADDTADFDLYVYRLDAAGQVAEVYTSATGSADEQVTIDDPTAGSWVAEVDQYAGTSAYTLTDYVVAPSTTVGTFSVAPSPIQGTQGSALPVTASWNGLTSGSTYFGSIRYGGSSTATYVTVDAS